jgi:hypothetical protein
VQPPNGTARGQELTQPVEAQLRSVVRNLRVTADACGSITLAGIAANAQQKDEAKRLAATVATARAVHTDQLRLRHEVQADVEQQLQAKGLKLRAVVSPAGLVTLTGVMPDVEQQRAVENAVTQVPEVTQVTWGRLQPQEIRQGVEDRLRSEGFTLCPPTGLPLQCDVLVTITDNGQVDLIGNERAKQVQTVIGESLGVTGVAWQHPPPGEILQWVQTRLRAKGFQCTSRGTFRRSCVEGVEVTPDGVVNLYWSLCPLPEEQREAGKLSGDVLGVERVTAYRVIRQERQGVITKECQN